MTEPRARRVTVVATIGALLLLVLVAAPASSARPSQEDIEKARDRLAAVTERLGAFVERFDQTQLQIDELTTQLESLRATRDRAAARAEEAQSQVDAAAVTAYKDPTSPLEILLSSRSIADLTERAQLLDTVAQLQEDIAIVAAVQGERARQMSVRVAAALGEQRDLLRSIGRQKATIERDAASLEAELHRLEEAFREPVVINLAPSAGPAPAPLAAPSAAPPPVSGEGAAAAIAAAESVIGTPYQYGGSTPQGGFDCSGLTMWSWAHAGVSLPHSSAAQYEALPHVPQSDLQPGDLVFFYNPIHHVGLYVGGGMMIDSPHTGTEVQRRPVEWDVFVGAARPT